MNEPYYIYFARARKSGLIKIGRTGNIAARISAIALSHGRMDLIAVMRTKERHAEQAMHHLLAAVRVRGEWFDLRYSDCERLIDYFLRRKCAMVRAYQEWARVRPERRKSQRCLATPRWIAERELKAVPQPKGKKTA